MIKKTYGKAVAFFMILLMIVNSCSGICVFCADSAGCKRNDLKDHKKRDRCYNNRSYV